MISTGALLLQRDIGNVVAMLQSMGEEKFGNNQMVMVKPKVLHSKPQITSSKSNVLHLKPQIPSPKPNVLHLKPQVAGPKPNDLGLKS